MISLTGDHFNQFNIMEDIKITNSQAKSVVIITIIVMLLVTIGSIISLVESEKEKRGTTSSLTNISKKK